MNTRAPFRIILVGLALGVLLALLLAPQSRWLVRYQLALVGLTVSRPLSEVYAQENQAQRVAAAHPNDYQMQLAMASGEVEAFKRLAFLRTLTARFGDNPSLYANLLRFQTMGYSPQKVDLTRPDQYELEPAGRKYDTPAPPSPAALAAFDADAAQGERLDPNNAYFPLMRAVGLFAAHHDAEGLAAVQRASTKPVWNEYIADETNDRLLLADATYGHAPSISRIAIEASELYPQYGPLRAMARLVTVLAVHAELAGNRALGMSIRRALMQDGDLMRVQSTTYIGSLVGIAISAIARSWPGGSAAVERPKHLTGDQWAQARMEAFAAYARQAGFPNDAARAEAQYAAGNTVRSLGKRGLDRSILNSRGLGWLAAGWIGGTLALVSAFWLVVLGLVGALLSRLPSVRNRQPLSTPARWGALAAFALAIGIVAFLAAESDTRPSIALVMALGIAGAVAVGALALRRGGEQGRQSLKTFAQALGVTSLMLMGLALVAAGQTRGILKFVQVQSGISGLSGGGGNGGSETSPLIAGLIATGIGLIVPCLLAIALSIRARKRRVPVSAALASGFRAAALPLACLLIVGYGAAVLGTLREEQRTDDGLRQMISHEGKYYASLAGAVWPGPV